jgi:hypothetical protein
MHQLPWFDEWYILLKALEPLLSHAWTGGRTRNVVTLTVETLFMQSWLA